ncbi:hypothetical protein MLD38_026157 [Melastoma candidum]|uniref:Uncharacterized protein n=1 Tax=Melastoma candidum TaxID=119954 RepID=A0ACB9P2U3_9MYRT|nr:hypothetical protein MLD38_026157 [Melastoma candidum]
MSMAFSTQEHRSLKPQRGVFFHEIFRKNKLLWSVDVHRMWEGGASTAIAVWLNDMKKSFVSGEDLPQLAAVTVVRGRVETSSASQDYPVSKASYSLLQDLASSYFSYHGRNKDRIVCQRTQLKRLVCI